MKNKKTTLLWRGDRKEGQEDYPKPDGAILMMYAFSY